jgi:hypothetical protein
MSIENKSRNTYAFCMAHPTQNRVIANPTIIELIPGINILNPNTENLLLQDDRFNELMAEGILYVSSVEQKKKVFKDDETGVSYIDQAGVKVPVSVQDVKIAPQESQEHRESQQILDTPKGVKMKASVLKKLGVSAENATKIIQDTPAEGYTDIGQLPNIGEDLDKVTVLFNEE